MNKCYFGILKYNNFDLEDLIISLIQQIPPHQQPLKEVLSNIVNSLEFDRITNLIENM